MEILDILMRKLKKEVDDVVLSYAVNNSRQIKFADNKIVKTGVEELSDVGIFVAKDKKIVTTNFKEVSNDNVPEGAPNNFKEKDVARTVKNILKTLKSIEPNKEYMGINDMKFKYKEIEDGYDSKIKDVDDVDFVEKGINASLNEGAKRTNGIFESHIASEEILTSNGVEYNEKGSELYFSIRSFFSKDESGHMNHVGRILKGFNIEKAGSESGRIAKDSKGVVNGKKGKYDILFSPLAFAPILNSIGESASIFSVESGLSFFVEKNW